MYQRDDSKSKKVTKPPNRGAARSPVQHQSFGCQALPVRDEPQGPSKADLAIKIRTLKMREGETNLTRQKETIRKIVFLKQSGPRIRNHQLDFKEFLIQIHTSTTVQEIAGSKIKVVTNKQRSKFCGSLRYVTKANTNRFGRVSTLTRACKPHQALETTKTVAGRKRARGREAEIQNQYGQYV